MVLSYGWCSMIKTECPHDNGPPCYICQGMDNYAPANKYPRGMVGLERPVHYEMCEHGILEPDYCYKCFDIYGKAGAPSFTVTGSNNPHYNFNGATCFAELVEQKHMSFNKGNILKSILRCDEEDSEYNLKKIIYYAEREIALLQMPSRKGDR